MSEEAELTSQIPDWSILLMKDLGAVKEAVRRGAEMYLGDYDRLIPVANT